jgi:hypothetical protein
MPGESAVNVFSLSWLIESKDAFLRHAVDFLWRQWSELGIAGASRSGDDRIIDPEALLLFSLGICRYEARLFDEIIDWLFKNGHFINVQRLQQIQKKYNFNSGPQLSAVASLLSGKSGYRLKWAGLAGKYRREPSEPLFLDKEGVPLPFPRGEAANPQFYNRGLSRGPVNLRGRSQSFDLDGPACLLLRLRALIGINARAEILCLLASAKEIHPSEAARQTGYYQKTVQTALVEMARSGAILTRTSRKEKYYRLKPNVIDSLLKPKGRTPLWIKWPDLFKSLEVLWQRIFEISKQKLEPLLLASELNKLIRVAQEYWLDPHLEIIEVTDNMRSSDVAGIFHKNLLEMLGRTMPSGP